MERMGRLPKNEREITGQNIPNQDKETEAMEPAWTLLMEKWGTQKEKDELEYALEKGTYYREK